jgi:hypothetical protein
VFCSPLLSFPDIRSLPSCLLASSYSRSSTTVSAAYNLSCLSVSLLFISFCLLFSTVFIVLFIIFSRAQNVICSTNSHKIICQFGKKLFNYLRYELIQDYISTFSTFSTFFLFELP